MPWQGAQYTESSLTIGSIPAEAKCPLGFKVGQDEGKMLDLSNGGRAGEGEMGD